MNIPEINLCCNSKKKANKTQKLPVSSIQFGTKWHYMLKNPQKA